MKKVCKVFYDGYNYLAMPYKNISDKTIEEIIGSDLINKKMLFMSEYSIENNLNKFNSGKIKDDNFYDFKKFNKFLKNLFYKLSINNDKSVNLEDDLFNLVKSDYEYNSLYHRLMNYDYDNLKYYIINFCVKERKNISERKSLFKKKAFNNEWNYFVTFTYNSELHDEQSFVKTLKNKLKNLKKSHNWLYMGCFERSKKERLHFHGLLYVPDGCMMGNIIEKHYYDTNNKKMAVSFINDEFDKKIGRNDFKFISKNDFSFVNCLNYITKYISKSDEKIFYSRGLKNEQMVLVDFDQKALCKMENMPYFILVDNDFIELDKNLNLIKK